MPTFFGGDTDEDNPSLPLVVRQLLKMSGSPYEGAVQTRTALNWRYYENDAYNAEFLGDAGDPAAEIQRAKQFWQGTRPLFSLCTEAADVDKRLVFKGARPQLRKRNDKNQDDIDKKWETEHWEMRVKRSVLYGAVARRSYLRVIPGWLEGKPKAPSRLDVYDPEVMTVLKDPHNHERLLGAKIEYMYTEPEEGGKGLLGSLGAWVTARMDPSALLSEGKQRWRTLIITDEEYFSFRDHKLYAYGKLGKRWPNPLGVVPVIPVPFNDIGHGEGRATFEHIIPTLDSINEMGTMFAQNIKMNSDPILVLYGVNPKTKLEKKTLGDGTTVWYIPQPPNFGTVGGTPQARAEYLEWEAKNLPQLLEFLKLVIEDCEAAVPEAHLKRIKHLSANSGYALGLQLTLLVDKVEEIREVQFNAVEDALQLALVSDAVGFPEDPSLDESRAKVDESRVTYDLKFIVDPVLGKDVATQAQISASEVAGGVISRRRARLDKGMTEREADAEEEQIRKEKAEEDEREMRKAKTLAALAPKPASSTGKKPQQRTAERSKAPRPTAPDRTIRAANPRTAGQPNAQPNTNRGSS
jgi:hypothetical protein